MTLLLRKQNAQQIIEGRQPKGWNPDDFAVLDAQVIGRIYKEQIHGEPKWLWQLQTTPAPLPNGGIADSFEEAKAAFAKRYAEVVKQGQC